MKPLSYLILSAKPNGEADRSQNAINVALPSVTAYMAKAVTLGRDP